MNIPYSVDYWYRHVDDEDQSIRVPHQMTYGATTEADVLTEIQRLQGHGYHIQRVIMRLVCTTCGANGRIGTRIKGARKDSRGQYAQRYRTCPTCRGDGWVLASTIEIPISVEAV